MLLASVTWHKIIHHCLSHAHEATCHESESKEESGCCHQDAPSSQAPSDCDDKGCCENETVSISADLDHFETEKRLIVSIKPIFDLPLRIDLLVAPICYQEVKTPPDEAPHPTLLRNHVIHCCYRC